MIRREAEEMASSFCGLLQLTIGTLRVTVALDFAEDGPLSNGVVGCILAPGLEGKMEVLVHEKMNVQ
jgi:hypothetical protein